VEERDSVGDGERHQASFDDDLAARVSARSVRPHEDWEVVSGALEREPVESFILHEPALDVHVDIDEPGGVTEHLTSSDAGERRRSARGRTDWMRRLLSATALVV